MGSKSLIVLDIILIKLHFNVEINLLNDYLGTEGAGCRPGALNWHSGVQ